MGTTASITAPASPNNNSGEVLLRRNFSSTIAGGVVYSGCQWLTMVLLVRLGTPAMVGQLALGLAVSAPIVACTSLQLRAIQSTDVQNRFAFLEFLALRVAGAVAALLATCVIVATSEWSNETRAVVLVIGIRGVIESFSDIGYGALQRIERLDIVARCTAVRSLAGFLAAAAAMVLTRSVTATAVASTLAWLTVLCVYERPVVARAIGIQEAANRNSWREIRRNAGELIAICTPLSLVMFCLSASQSLPRLYLQRYAGEDGLGVFSALSTLSGGIGVIYLALGQAALPRLSQLHVRGTGEFRYALGRIILFALGLGACGLIGVHVFGGRILRIAYGSRFDSYRHLFTGLMACAVIGNICLLLGVAATASRNYWPQLLASIAAVGSAALSAGYFIPAFALTGALYSVLTVAVVQATAYACLCARSIAFRTT